MSFVSAVVPRVRSLSKVLVQPGIFQKVTKYVAFLSVHNIFLITVDILDYNLVSTNLMGKVRS